MLFAAGTSLSRITGLVRQSVVAATFGAGLTLDAFNIANRIPNLLREMLAEGALGASFTKSFTVLWDEDKDRAKKALYDSLWLCIIAVGIVTVVGMLAAPWLVKLMTLFGDQRENQDIFLRYTTSMTRILFPFIFLMSISAIVGGVLHQQGNFFYSAVSPILLNLGYIFGALVLSGFLEATLPGWVDEVSADRRILGLTFGVLLGGLGQVIVQIYGIWKPVLATYQKKGSVFPLSKDIKHILAMMTPMIIASSASQINILVNSNFATSLEHGAVTWLEFSFRLIHLPIGIFGVAIGVVSLPRLTRAVRARLSSKGDTIGEELQNAADLTLWLIVPCFAFFLINSESIVRLLFQYGKFDEKSVIATSGALYCYSFCLIGYGLVKILTSLYYALERTNYAMKVSLLSIISNAAANTILVNKYGHLGLATTTGITVSLNALLLITGLRGEKLSLHWSNIKKSGFLLVLAAVLAIAIQMGNKSLLLSQIFLGYIDPVTKIGSLIQILVNGSAVFLVFWLLGSLRLGKKPMAVFSMLKSR